MSLGHELGMDSIPVEVPCLPCGLCSRGDKVASPIRMFLIGDWQPQRHFPSEKFIVAVTFPQVVITLAVLVVGFCFNFLGDS